MACPTLILLVILVLLNISHENVLRKTISNASMGMPYWGKVGNGQEDIYHFTLPNAGLQNSTVRIISTSRNGTENVPVIFVARLVRGVVSWSIPFVTDEGGKYNHVTQTLCPSMNQEGVNKPMQDIFLDISSASSQKLTYNFTARIQPEFSLQPAHLEKSTVNPAEPTFFIYEFTGKQERVVVKVESGSKTCAELKIQTECPASGSSNSDHTGVYATFTTRAAIVIERNRIEEGKDGRKKGRKFYVVLKVKDTDTECQKRKGTINPFAPPREKDEFYKTKEKIPATLITTREKRVTVSVEVLPNIADYLIPILAPVFFFGGFYVIGIIILVTAWCRSDDGGKSIYAYLFPPKVKDDDDDEEDNVAPEQERLLTTPSQSRRQSYGTENLISPVNAPVDAIQPVRKPSENGEVNDEDTDGRDYDWLEDINKHKDVYRMKANLTVEDLSRKSYKKLNKKINVYYWNILTVAVFYALPVAQLVLTYQRVVNTSGDQDICYYNNFCQRPYHLFSAFNNVYSNIGYIMLGILFILLVVRRDRLSKQKYVRCPETEKKYGIPKHYGILYAMGFALFMEGMMSACYHVCPNYSNFQFDTAFMYMIGILGCLRLYQSRHHDLIVNAHFAYAGLALIIFVAVLGVVFRSREFWAFFMLAHFAACFYVSCQIYYMGRIKTAIRVNWVSARRNFCTRPVFPFRLALLAVFNLVNWALSINGIVSVPNDFMTYLLGIIVCNGLLYVAFYGVMKFFNGERIKLLPSLCIIASIVTWGISISFFVQGLTNWQVSPAESREGNRDCRILNFYDDHDLWHFLSATAMFFSFISMLTIDDDLNAKERYLIRVF